MQRSTALMRIEKNVVESAMANLRVALRARALDEGMPRVWMEALEARRMLSDGFGVNGWTSAAFPGMHGYGIPINSDTTADGKFYVVGDVGDWADTWGLARFNMDGSVDRTFGANGTGTETFSLGEWSSPDAVLVLKDGKFLVTAECGGGLAIARFNENGSLDTSFGGGAKVYDVFNGYQREAISGQRGVWVTAEGKVILTRQHGADLVTLRLTANGAVDETFGLGGIATARVDAGGDVAGADTMLGVRQLKGGGAIAYEEVWSYPDDPNNPGSPDPWADAVAQLYQVRLDDQGKLVSEKKINVPFQPGGEWLDYMLTQGYGGSFFVMANDTKSSMAKFDANGEPDLSFGDHGIAGPRNGYSEIEALLPDGRIVLMTGIQNSVYIESTDSLIMLRADGSVDASFNGGQPFSKGGNSAALLLDDGSLLLMYPSGTNAPAATPTFRVEKILPDGSVAPSASGIDLNALAADLTAADVPFAPADHGVFATAPGMSAWDPDGKKDVWDEGGGAV